LESRIFLLFFKRRFLYSNLHLFNVKYYYIKYYICIKDYKLFLWSNVN